MDPGARCATHPDATAVDTCTRCGNFVCASCLEVEEWEVYCPDCFARVGKSAPASARATTALVLGLIGMSGCLPFGFAGMALGYLEKGAIERGESEPGGRNLAVGAIWIGWLTIALSVGLVLLFVLIATLEGR